MELIPGYADRGGIGAISRYSALSTEFNMKTH